MILWFGKNKKEEELKEAGAAMESPELSADELATREAEAARKIAEQEEIERKVAEANKAWEERQAREAEAAAAEAKRLDEEVRKADEARAAAQARADDAEAARLAEEAERALTEIGEVDFPYERFLFWFLRKKMYNQRDPSLVARVLQRIKRTGFDLMPDGPAGPVTRVLGPAEDEPPPAPLVPSSDRADAAGPGRKG